MILALVVTSWLAPAIPFARAAEVADNAPAGDDWLADAELLAERLVAKGDADTTGSEATKSVRLADVLTDVDTTAARLDTVRAYWDLWATEASLRHRTAELARINQLVATGGTAADPLVAVQAKWQALVETARGDVASARKRLVELAPQATDKATTADVPHVGPYRTEFERLFAGRSVAGYMFLLSQTMPLRHRALSARAVAIDGALAMSLESATAARDGDSANDEGEAFAWRLEQLRRQRSSFVELVRRYNHDIARYALSVAPEDVATEQLVGMLVLGAPTQSASGATADDGSPGHRYVGGGNGASPVATPGSVAYNLLPARPHFSAADGSSRAESLAAPGGNVGPKRVVQVMRTLFAVDADDDNGESLTLADALGQPESDRMTVLTNYWWAATSAARLRAMKDLLSELVLPPEYGSGADNPTNRRSPLGWAYFAQLADVYEAEIDSRTAMHELVAASHWQGSADLHTATPPHAGRYRTKASRQEKWQTDRDELEQLAAQVTEAYQALDLRGTLYVDALRAGASSTSSLTADPDAAVRAWQRRHDTVDDFLAALGDYNVAIGQYVLAVLPADEPTDDLVATLVVTKK